MRFDEYADDYDRALAEGLSVSGEDKDYFARGRIAWLARRLGELDLRPRSVLDFGCGIGSATPFFAELLAPESILGVDRSPRSIEVANRTHGGSGARFIPMGPVEPGTAVDLAFSNGVFHHIPPAERAAAVDYVRRSLRPGGVFAFWENNPWNPGTRLVMRRISFDRDAIPLAAPAARRLLTAGGFTVLRTDFLFVFPRFLRWLRPLEATLAPLPLGAQYLVLGRRT